MNIASQDFADLKDKPNHRAPNFSRHSISKYRIKTPSKPEAEHVDAAAAGGLTSTPRAEVGVLGEDERSRRIRRLYEHSAASPLDATPSKRSRKRRSHDKFGNHVSIVCNYIHSVRFCGCISPKTNHYVPLHKRKDERAQRQQEITDNRNDRQNRRRLMRAMQTQNFYKSLHMIQANQMLRESDSSTPFEDYSIYMYRQSAPEFGDRVKELERKLMYPVSG